TVSSMRRIVDPGCRVRCCRAAVSRLHQCYCGQVARGRNGVLPFAPKIFCRAIPDARKQFRHAFECDFITRIGYEANKRGDILNMRLLEEPDATGDLIRYAAP